MHSKISKFILFISLLFTAGCKNTFDEPAVSRGNADFSRFVALGGYYAAGFGDGALHYDLQKNSFPAILASRFALVGGGNFKQPLVNPGSGLSYDQNFNLIARLTLNIQKDCQGNDALIATRESNDASNEIPIGCQSCQFNNLAVPGAKSFNLSKNTFGRGLPLGNLYYHRFATDNVVSSSVLGDAIAINPTFYVLWVGNEDIWQYARSGGNGKLNGIGINDITPLDTFNTSYDEILSSLNSGNISKGALANIPDIDCFPFFTAIPYNGLELTSAEATKLNSTSTGFNFHAGENAFVVHTPNSSLIRQLVTGEYVLISVPSDSITCSGWGTPQNPIPDNYILDSAEVANITDRTTQFNNKISATANFYNLAFVDMQSFFRTFKSTQSINGVHYTNQFLKNSIFSLDGLYPNARGQAYIANAFIRAINSKYMSTLPLVDVNNYRGNSLP